MTSNFSKMFFALFVFSITFIGCQEEEYEIKYSVISGVDNLPAIIIYKDSGKSDQVLPTARTPWNYIFTGEEGDSIKVSANIYSDGTLSIIGTDTLRVMIFINGVKYKENFVVITNSGSDIAEVSGIIP